MNKYNIVILAAGKGERMLSKKPKVMHEIIGKPMIGHVVETSRRLNPSTITVITGFGRDRVEAYLKRYDVSCAVQEEQLGTAHALLMAEKYLKTGDVLVLYGDVPLMDEETLSGFTGFYEKTRSITFMATALENPGGYGRVIMEGDDIIEIVEEAEATDQQKEINMINTGMCIIPWELFPLLKLIKNENRKGEFYLTDICRIARQKGFAAKGYCHADSTEVLGVNGRKELLEANMIMKDRVIDAHLRNGVTFLDRNVYIGSDVVIGRDSIIYPNTHITGNTRIGDDVIIGPGVIIRDSILHDSIRVEGFSIIEGVELHEGVVVEPFTHVRRPIITVQNKRVHGSLEIKGSILTEGAADAGEKD